MVNHRTAVVSQIRALLLDRGFAIAKSITRARRAIPEILAGQDNELTAMIRDAIAELYDLFRDLDRRIGLFDKKIDRIFHEDEACQRIAKIKGVGPKTATTILEAWGQHVDQEASDDVGRQGHRLVPARPLDPIVLVLEGDALLAG
jgi:transposase